MFRIALGFLLLSFPVYGQTKPEARSLTFTQIEGLEAALEAIDRGSPDQCDAKSPSSRVCPYHKTTTLTITMARDIVALNAAHQEVQIMQNSVRAEVLAEPRPGLTEAQSNAIQSSVFTQRLAPMMNQTRDVTLVHLRMSDLDLGNAPDHNQLPSSVIAAMAIIIDDFER